MQRYLGALSRFDFLLPGANQPLLVKARNLAHTHVNADGAVFGCTFGCAGS